MEKLQFKTNINCGNCVSKVTLFKSGGRNRKLEG
jgi:hypothetical protein